jgi:hypothetical protein
MERHPHPKKNTHLVNNIQISSLSKKTLNNLLMSFRGGKVEWCVPILKKGEGEWRDIQTKKKYSPSQQHPNQLLLQEDTQQPSHVLQRRQGGVVSIHPKKR